MVSRRAPPNRARTHTAASQAIQPAEWEVEMVRIWSELPGARLKEQLADLATVAWVLLWGGIALQLYLALVGFSEAGRIIRSGGQTMIDSGRELGGALAGIPLVGGGLQDAAQDAFAGAGVPLSDFGTSVEQFIVLVSSMLALLVALVFLVPWLTRYVPWRWERVRRTRAGHRAIRIAPEIEDVEVRKALALRAVTRLDYAALLEYTPDPIGDWASGRHDRLARAELASVGLRP
jgi:hypothetical protein